MTTSCRRSGAAAGEEGRGARPAATPQADAPPSQNARPSRWRRSAKPREVVAELTEQKILRAAYSDRQLEEVMTDFWFNHFNVFAGKGATQHVPDRVRARRDSAARLRQVPRSPRRHRESPAMLFYLDNWQSADPNAPDAGTTRCRRAVHSRRAQPASAPDASAAARQAQTRTRTRQKRGLNENYGRELMELHTLGVDGGYTQQDVIDVARAFTGLDHRRSAPGRQLPVRAADPRPEREDRARPQDQGRRRAVGRREGARHPGEPSLDGAVHLDEARAPLRLRHAAAGARRSRRGAVPRDRRRHPRSGANDPDVAGVLLRRGLSREGEDARSSSSSRPSARPAPRSATRSRSRRPSVSSACRSTCASRRPATPTRRTPGSTPARCSTA